MKAMKAIISENTPISIGLLITLTGGIFWLSTSAATRAANDNATAEAIIRIEKKQNHYEENQYEIIQKLSRIEGKLDGRRNR